MSTYDTTSPAQGHQALGDIDSIRANLNALRNLETCLEASLPSNPEPGQFCRTSDTKKYYMRNQANTAWLLMWFEPAAGAGYGPAWYYPTGEDASDRNLKTHLDKNITAAVAVHGIKQGSGNGLDADKLDGQHASAFSTVGHVHTGFQSGLDADKLDGQEGSYYRGRANHTGTQPISTLSDHTKANHDSLGIAPGDETVTQTKMVYAVGSCIIKSADTEGLTSSTVLVPVKGIRVTRKGTVRVTWEFHTSASQGVETRIYKNSTPMGNLHQTAFDTWQTATEDITVDPGDIIYLYARRMGTQNCYYRNYRIKAAQYQDEVVTLDI